MALVALRTHIGARLFVVANDLANDFIGFADAGIRFVFGNWPAVAVVQHAGRGGGCSRRWSASCWR